MAQPQQATVSSAADHRLLPSSSCVSLGFPQGAAAHNLINPRAHLRSSQTWTTSSGELGLLSDTDEVNDRIIFVQEYNRLAKKHGIRLLIIEDFERKQKEASPSEKRSWFHRIFRSATHHQQSPPDAQPPSQAIARHRRSISDLAHIIHGRREPPKVVDIQSMIRLSGKSVLYLPSEYSPCSLVLPTCIRATAQHLAQHSATRGIFRIPGSARVVNTLFEYYCHVERGAVNIAGTVRCVTLPLHIQYSVHDVASTFKRLLSVLPGGILGSLPVFDALVAINSQLHGDPEFPRTKRTKIRARLIALAIGTIGSQFRRELVCAVFGLLSLIGRIAEISPREDQEGRPLPTGDLMGYTALGIVFGPLLVRDLLDRYTMRLAAPNSGMLLFPLSPQKRRDSRKNRTVEPNLPNPPTIDKVLVANTITEMVISNWRDIVRQMQTLGTHHRRETSSVYGQKRPIIPPSLGAFSIKMPPDLNVVGKETGNGTSEQDGSPEPATPKLGVRRSRLASNTMSNRLPSRISNISFAPTLNDKISQGSSRQNTSSSDLGREQSPLRFDRSQATSQWNSHSTIGRAHASPYMRNQNTSRHGTPQDCMTELTSGNKGPSGQGQDTKTVVPQVYFENAPPRVSSRQTINYDRSGTFLSSSLEEDITAAPSHIPRVSESPTANRHNEYANSKDQDLVTSQSTSNHHWNEQTTTSPIHNSDPIQTRSDSSEALHPQRSTSTPKMQDRKQLTRADPDGSGKESVIAQEYEPDGVRNLKKADDAGVDAKIDDTLGGKPWDTSQNASANQTTASKVVKDLARDSCGATPKQFYRPMRMPRTFLDNAGQLLQSRSTPCVNNSETQVTGDSSGTLENDQHEVPLLPPDWKFGDNTPTYNPTRRRSPGLTFKSPSNHNNNTPQLGSDGITKRPRECQSLDHMNSKHSLGPVSPMTKTFSPTKRGSVKAMTAMFENQEVSRSTSPVRNTPQPQDNNESMPFNSSPTRLGQQLTREPTNTTRSSKSVHISRRSLPVLPVEQHYRLTRNIKPELRKSTSCSVYLRSNALEDGRQGRQNRSPRKTSAYHQRQSLPALNANPGGEMADRALRHAASLGTMVPHPEGPQIARHLKLTKPSTPSSRLDRESDEPRPVFQSSIPATNFGSTTILYAQIQSLRRHLDVRCEEAAQLRRQLQAHEESEIGTLSEQLRVATGDVATWKSRAEAAEKRIKVFENFMKKMRTIKEWMAPQVQSDDKEEMGRLPPHASQGDREIEKENQIRHQHVRFADGEGSLGRGASDDSGIVEEGGVVPARIRACRHGAAKHDGPLDGPSMVDQIRGETQKLDENKKMKLGMGEAVTEMWDAVDELLLLEDQLVL